MDNQIEHERILIVIALLLCAVIIGYNAFFVPEVTSPTVIYVQSQPAGSATATDEEYTPAAPLNLNTATQQQLIDTLPDVGEVTAQRIIQYREEHGVYQTVDELKQVEGIGEKTFAKIKPYVVVE